MATDLAARGIDIDALPHVVNFELPMAPEDYVHRIGRTARAGMDGDAVSLVCVDESKLLWQIESMLRTKIAVEPIAGFEPDRSIRPEPIRLTSARWRRPAVGSPDPARVGAGPSIGTAEPRVRAGVAAGRLRRSGAAPPERPAPERPTPGRPTRTEARRAALVRAVLDPAARGRRRTARADPAGRAGRPLTALPGERIARTTGHGDDRSPQRDDRAGR